MILYFHIHIKFRWGGVTWGTLDEKPQWKTPFNIPIPIPPFHDTIFDSRGVLIEVHN